MRPFFFGQAPHRLFGVLHEPEGDARQTAILICPPWGAEYMRSYRGLRQFAGQLARRGYPVLRFDYRGTGDSAGDARTVTLADWIADVATAGTELRTASGVSRLAVLGLRFGTLIAQQAVKDGVSAEALVLWDAPPSGAVYVENLQHVDGAAADLRNRYRAARVQLPPPETDELLGYHWPAEMQQQLVTLPGLRDDLALPCQVFVSRDRTPPEGVDSERLPDASHWSDSTHIYSPWIPSASFTAVVDRLVEVLP